MALGEILTFGSGPATPGPDLVRAVHSALVEALKVPNDDPTVWHANLDEHSSIVANRHGADAVLVRVTMFQGRTDETVRRLHEVLADQMESVGVPRASVLVVIVESPPQRWSIAGVPQDQAEVGFDIDI